MENLGLELGYEGIITFSVALFVLCFIVVLRVGSNSYSSRIFNFLAIAYIIWTTTLGFFFTTTNQELGLLLLKLSFLEGAATATTFFYFSLVFPEEQKPKPWLKYLLIVLLLAQAPLYLVGSLLITNIEPSSDLQNWRWSLGSASLVFNTYFTVLWASGISSLYRKIPQHTGQTKTQLEFMFVVMVFGIVPPALLSVLLPEMGFFTFNWMGPSFGILWMLVFGYSILKHNQMKIKVVFTEVLVLSAIILFFIGIIL